MAGVGEQHVSKKLLESLVKNWERRFTSLEARIKAAVDAGIFSDNPTSSTDTGSDALSKITTRSATWDKGSTASSIAKLASDAASSALALASDAASKSADGSNALSKITAKSATWDKGSAASSGVLVVSDAASSALALASDAASKADVSLSKASAASVAAADGSNALSKITAKSAVWDKASAASSQIVIISDAASSALAQSSDAASKVGAALSKAETASSVAAGLSASVSDAVSKADAALSKASDTSSVVAGLSDSISDAVSKADLAMSKASDVSSVVAGFSASISDALSKSQKASSQVLVVSDAASSALAAAQAVSDVASNALSKAQAASTAAADGSNALSKIGARSATWDKASAASSQIVIVSDAASSALAAASDATSKTTVLAGAEYVVGAANATLSAEIVKAYMGDNYDPDAYPVSPDGLDDEFEDGSLNVKWTLVNDPGIAENTYAGYIYSTFAENGGTDNFDALVRMYQTPPTGTSTMTFVIKATSAVGGVPNEQGEFLEVSVYLGNSADDEFVACCLQINNAASANQVGRVQGLKTALAAMATANVQIIDATKFVYLKLEKSTNAAYTSANTYNAYFSLNGIIWYQVGTDSVTFTNLCDEVGIYFRTPKSQTGTAVGYGLVDFFRRTA